MRILASTVLASRCGTHGTPALSNNIWRCICRHVLQGNMCDELQPVKGDLRLELGLHLLVQAKRRRERRRWRVRRPSKADRRKVVRQANTAAQPENAKCRRAHVDIVHAEMVRPNDHTCRATHKRLFERALTSASPPLQAALTSSSRQARQLGASLATPAFSQLPTT